MKTLTLRNTGTGILLAGVVVSAALMHPARAQAQGVLDTDERVAKGLAIAPVPLNMTGKNRSMVGLGSYLVNAVGGCVDCHTEPTYAVGGDPYMGQPKKINAANYLAGGAAFGPFISRNLTPDYTGIPEGGHPLSEFIQIIRTGVDLEKQHPQISPLLQVMPWPVYQGMTDIELQSIYEFLSTVPCVEGGPGVRPNRCSSPAIVPAITLLPMNLTTSSKTLQLDASGSTSLAGGPLRYSWENVLGSPYVSFSDASSASPTITFLGGPGTYSLQLSVIDPAGGLTTMQVKVNYNPTP